MQKFLLMLEKASIHMSGMVLEPSKLEGSREICDIGQAAMHSALVAFAQASLCTKTY